MAGGTWGEVGCFACSALRTCTLHQSGALQIVNRIQSRYDVAWHSIRKRLTCATPNVVYYILCPCGHPTDYVGSTGDFKRRWSGHKNDIRSHNWKAWGLTRHFGDYHSEKGLKRIEDKCMVNLGTLFTGANSRNEVLSNKRRNYGGS